jgi:hypothetical protein
MTIKLTENGLLINNQYLLVITNYADIVDAIALYALAGYRIIN